MEFGNPIIGLEELIRAAIRSKNYVAGSAGWRIAADGSAEFSTVLLRGSGVGDIIIIGPAGLPQVDIGSTTTFGYIKFPTNGPIENFVARILSRRGNADAVNEFGGMIIDGPSVNGIGATDRIQMQLNSQNNDGTSNANWSVVTVNNGSLLIADKDQFNIFPILRAAGGIYVGTTDVKIYREAADVLTTDDIVRIYRGVVGDNAISVRVVGDTVSRLFINADGSMNWGPGGSTGVDTNLYRSAANTLATDDVFVAGNHAFGTVTITPVANTPTSVTVSGLNVQGTAFRGYATAVTTVIGSSVMGAAVSSVTSTSLLVWVYRTNTTNTGVNWEVWGEP